MWIRLRTWQAQLWAIQLSCNNGRFVLICKIYPKFYFFNLCFLLFHHHSHHFIHQYPSLYRICSSICIHYDLYINVNFGRGDDLQIQEKNDFQVQIIFTKNFTFTVLLGFVCKFEGEWRGKLDKKSNEQVGEREENGRGGIYGVNFFS